MISDANGMDTTMLVSPANAGNGFGNGFGGDGWWIVLLILLFAGNNGFGGNGANGLYPWLNQADQVNGGFRDQMISSNISEIQSSLNNISTQLCNGFAGVEQGANTRQIADMQQMFANQMAMTQGFSGVQSQLAQCCCDNRAATADVKYTIATEACNTRAANAANTQSILDKLCQLEMDNYKRENEQLRSQLNFANMQASQNAQTAAILANNEAQTTALEQYLAPVPRPAYVVQNPNCCAQNYYGCGCGA